MADGMDDLLDPSEIENLLKSAGALGGGPPSTPAASAPAPAPAPIPDAGEMGDLLSGNEIEALLAQHTPSARPVEPPAPAAPALPRFAPDELLNEAQAGLQMAQDLGMPPPPSRPKPPPDPRLAAAQPYELEAFDSLPDDVEPGQLRALEEVELDLRIELGRCELLIEEVLKLREGSVVPLDKLAGDPVDILVNGKLIARGEVLVLNDNFCVRVAEILSPAG